MTDENIHYLIKAVNASFVSVVVQDDLGFPVLCFADSGVFVSSAHQDNILIFLGQIFHKTVCQ